MNTTQTNNKEEGIIIYSGMGGFLKPPTHPEHTHSVRENGGSMSLSVAVECEYLDDAVKNEAKKLLNEWQAPDINSPEIKEWIYEILGYFNHCYSKGGINRSVNDGMEIIEADPFKSKIIDRHLGVIMIREYYPKYTPTKEDFKNAYWGKK